LLQIRLQQEQIVALQALVAEQARERAEEEEVEVAEAPRSNSRLYVNVVKLPTFNRDTSKVLEFLTACRLCIKMKMRDTLVEGQVQ